ncbi:glycosyltransferase [Lactobacillus phage 521B]|uniref:Glycosyltransferase n=1 Tax=Lactobacillus phage 521B TaxID=2510942 RepID=A0A4Y5FEM0_9CAUD|nr:glycosyltransferase [Lactobacillus phage 521B]QBJ03503.1 glycosyltransferase [Lactobacillus phage 521B]
MKKYITSPNSNQFSYDGAVKPRLDTANTLVSLGYEKINFNMYGRIETGSNEYKGIMKQLDSLKEGDLVIQQVPSYCSNEFDTYLSRYIIEKGAYSVALVHDVDTLRGFYPNFDSERIVFNSYDLLVVASDKLKKYLIDSGITTKIIIRGPWDYLQNLPYRNHKIINNIYYAGNLSKRKAGFLETFNKNTGLVVTVCGKINNSKDYIDKSSVDYLGPVNPNTISFSDGWGLIWDNEEDNSDNFYHNYQEYNWPAKLSVYLRSGIPVILSKKAQAYGYIKDNHLGVGIDDIKDIPNVLEKLSEEEKNKISNSCFLVSKKIGSGYYTKQMSENILKELNIERN